MSTMAWLSDSLTHLENPVLQGILAALGTFILEDATTVTCGLLVADNRMTLAAAYVGLASGIALGDLGLYIIGRLCGARIVAWGWVSKVKMERARLWFDRNLVMAVVLSRFIPGMRTSTYSAAGIFSAHPWKFLTAAICASLVWTALLLFLVIQLGETVLPLLGEMKLPLALLAICAFVSWQVYLFQRGKALSEDNSPATPVVSFFEFWPPWLFYFPLACYYALLALRYRGLMLPMNTNPHIYSSGVLMESKSEILSLIPGPKAGRVARWVAIECSDTPVDDELLNEVEKQMSASGIQYPIVAKPDIGERGRGVRPVKNRRQLQWYLQRFPGGKKLILQELVPWEGEAGILYYRLPGSKHGRISSITLKSFPRVVGDGVLTLRELIEADPRAKRISNVYLTRHRAHLDRVLSRGKKYRLVFAGNHCQGTVFQDGTKHVTREMTAAFEQIARSIPEFHYGRFDVRYESLDALRRGEGFRIIEVNGAAGEATHIWDAEMTLTDAWKDLFHHLQVLFEIGSRNRRRGFRPIGPWQFGKDLMAWRRASTEYPPTL